MPIPPDYAERVYAGVLGKIIGVYLGRPFEGWTYERIIASLGEITYYVHERLNKPLIVTDDDISGTFTFLRALPDNDYAPGLTAAQIGHTWLNYIIENRSILWWGGIGNSTEHTAFLRLHSGVDAPRSGSIALNGQTVAEQIGAQIFIDGWGMVAPGDPERAADLARRAASVSHDGEAIYGAQVVAAMEALAFVEADINRLIDTAVGLIPRDALIRRLIDDIRNWHAQESDWRKTRAQIAAHYGYDKFGGTCHMVPNHALIIHALLHGGGDFQQSLMIVNTCGWDTDCNSGNVGCLLGIRNGLAGIDAGPDWRGPVADRMYLSTAEGGRGVTDAATEAVHVVNAGRALAGLAPLAPKQGARFHFEFPGAVQGFRPDPHGAPVTLANVAGHSTRGQRSLAIHYRHVAPGQAARVATATFIPPDAVTMPGYGLSAAPTLYPGQQLTARVEADAANAAPVTCRLYIESYGADDAPRPTPGPEAVLAAGASHEFAWRIPDTGGAPIAHVGLAIVAEHGARGTLYLDWLGWVGTPVLTLDRPAHNGTLWRRAWVDASDKFYSYTPEPFGLVQNRGTGLLMQGTREWTDYQVSTTVLPLLAKGAGIAVRVQGLRRYYALLLCDDGTARLVKQRDRQRTVLAEAPFPWLLDGRYHLRLQAVGAQLQGWVDGRPLLAATDTDRPLRDGGLALVVEEGNVRAEAITVGPAA